MFGAVSLEYFIVVSLPFTSELAKLQAASTEKGKSFIRFLNNNLNIKK